MAVKTAHACNYDESFFDNDDTVDEELSSLYSKGRSLPIISSEDIWKKFDLPPTPPRSPVQSLAEYSKECICCLEYKRNECSLPYSSLCACALAERLQETIVSFDYDTLCSSSGFRLVNQVNALNSLRSKLIHDCMWNGRNSIDRKVKEKKHSHLEDHIYDTPCSSPPPHDYSSADCVDPSAVFPYSLTDCSSASQSESEEEIDVVTVDKPTLKRTLSDSMVIFDGVSEVPSLKRSRSSPSTQSTESKPKIFNQFKKLKKPERRQYEDLDPEQRRATHNVLERKRRNDLKSSFLTLRSSIPTLGEQDKTPKVTILRRASEYVQELIKEEEELTRQKEQLRKEQRELLEKFVRLSKTSRKDLKKKLPGIDLS